MLDLLGQPRLLLNGLRYTVNFYEIFTVRQNCKRFMIVSFKDRGTEDLFNRRDTRAARKVCPIEIWSVAQRKLNMLAQAKTLADLRIPPSNQLHALKQDRMGQHAIRINDQYRVCFHWSEEGAEDVEVTDYH